MPIVASSGGDYAPAPAGLHTAVAIDVVDHGMVETPFGQKHRVSIIWALGDELDERGRPFEVRKTYTLSLGKKAILRADLEAWRGKAFTADQLMGWDIEQIIGVNCQVMITHVAKNERTYANVTAIVPPSKGSTKLSVPTDYVRRRDREEKPKTEIQKAMAEVDDFAPPF